MRIDPSTLSPKVREDFLIESFNNATRRQGEISFLREVRTEKNDDFGKYSVKLDRLRNIFKSSVWFQHKTKSGHLKFSHKVTGIIIEFKNHGRGNNVDPGAVETIKKNLQEHENILGNEIFMFKSKNWQSLPDLRKVSRVWISFYNSSIRA